MLIFANIFLYFQYLFNYRYTRYFIICCLTVICVILKNLVSDILDSLYFSDHSDVFKNLLYCELSTSRSSFQICCVRYQYDVYLNKILSEFCAQGITCSRGDSYRVFRLLSNSFFIGMFFLSFLSAVKTILHLNHPYFMNKIDFYSENKWFIVS